MNPRRNGDTAGFRCESELRQRQPLGNRLAHRARCLTWAALGQLTSIPDEQEWVHFLFYHWVLDDQRRSFRRQLAFLRQHGDFIGLDDALAAQQSRSGVGGRYYCLTFDDGFRNAYTNVVPILRELAIPAAFFIPTQYIGLDLNHDWEQIVSFYERSGGGSPGALAFLNWDECRLIAEAGYVIGSHTHSHPRLTDLNPEAARHELVLSKQLIETQLQRPCRHFCCPWGKDHRDFDPALHPPMAREVGYDSFLTTEEGPCLPGDSPYYLRRTGCEPEFAPAVLRYSLFSPLSTRRRSLLRHKPEPTPEPARPTDPAPSHREHQFYVLEPELVQLGSFPYPFEAGFTIASDIDSASLERFRVVHALIGSADLNGVNTPEARATAVQPGHSWSNDDLSRVGGLGLDLADSFFLVGDNTTFGMYRNSPKEGRFQFDQQDGQNCCEVIRRALKEGRVDCYHAFLHFTRNQLVPLLAEFYAWCEREDVPKPKVWINHSLAVTPTGLCPDSLQQAIAERLVRLTGRKLVGPLFGRQPQPLRYAFARYQGDTPGSPHYVNDLLAANGLRYVWLNVNDLHPNRIALPEHSLNCRRTILQPVTMDDGVRYYRFDRCYGKPLHRLGAEAYLRDSAEGFDASCLITQQNLETLCRSGGTCILYTHWTHPRSFPLSEVTISRFELLRQWRDSGRLWITSTAKLLEWTRRRTFLRVTTRREGQRLTIDLDGVDDPVFGWEAVTLADLNGLCLHLSSSQPEVRVAVHGEPLNADQVHRSGNLCWLDASIHSRVVPRPPQSRGLRFGAQRSVG